MSQALTECNDVITLNSAERWNGLAQAMLRAAAFLPEPVEAGQP